jgi:hypothetical protein
MILQYSQQSDFSTHSRLDLYSKVTNDGMIVHHFLLYNPLLNSDRLIGCFMVTWYWIENSIPQKWNEIGSIALFTRAIVLYVLFHCTLRVCDKSHRSLFNGMGLWDLMQIWIVKMAGTYSKLFNIQKLINNS